MSVDERSDAAPANASPGRGSLTSLVPPRPTARAIAAAADVDARAVFERRLVREILRAERFRARLLFFITTLALFLMLGASRIYPDAMARILHAKFDLAPVGLFLAAVAAFELYLLAWTGRLLDRGERPRPSRRYLHAFVETSLPTAAILYYATSDDPLAALLMPSAFVYFVFILLSTLGLDFFLCAFTGVVAASEYAVMALLFRNADAGIAAVAPTLASLPHHLGKAVVLLVSGIAAAFVARRLRRSFTSAIESVGERARILGVFGQHVSPEVVERLVAGKTEVKSELRPVCVMFLDIRNFTAFSESKRPDEVVDYLNAVFETTVESVVSHQGIVNKFLGDGFMAVFGAPIAEGNPSLAAIEAALDIVDRVARLAPSTEVGIALHTGSAVVGNIGSAQRKEYTVIGDVVNVAARMETLNKELGSRVLVSDATWTASGAPAGITATAHEGISLRGRKEKLRVWQLA
jgi:adenylate cyclase